MSGPGGSVSRQTAQRRTVPPEDATRDARAERAARATSQREIGGTAGGEV